jgi:hypothetical protein
MYRTIPRTGPTISRSIDREIVRKDAYTARQSIVEVGMVSPDASRVPPGIEKGVSCE